ncbi:MAG TPA: hypothetical protein VLM20_00415 [Methylophilaceae bacterium]|nr:hypothetical protein [Methylophilaceae bacterium]
MEKKAEPIIKLCDLSSAYSFNCSTMVHLYGKPMEKETKDIATTAKLRIMQSSFEGDLYLVPATDITIIGYPAIKKLHALLSDFIKEMEHEKNAEEAITDFAKNIMAQPNWGIDRDGD